MRANFSDLSVILHGKTPTDNTVVRPIVGPQGLVHRTQLPGGFWQCSFTIPTTEGEYWDWRENRILHRLRLNETGGYVIWEGRLETVELLDFWLLRLTFYGYWSNWTDARFASASGQKISYATTGDVILKDFRDTHMHADTIQLSLDNTQITLPGVTLTLDFDRDLSLWEAIEQLLDFGDSANNPMDMMIYENRVIQYKARNPTAITWQAKLSNAFRFVPRLDWKDTSNAINVTYDSAGSVLRTGYSVDTPSVARFIRRELVVPNIGTSNLASATARRDTELALRKDLQQQTDDIVLTEVRDANGQPAPLCRVRAGDVVRFIDFVPRTTDAASATPVLDGFRTFVVVATECDHDGGRLTIRPDRKSQSISHILSRRGIR